MKLTKYNLSHFLKSFLLYKQRKKCELIRDEKQSKHEKYYNFIHCSYSYSICSDAERQAYMSVYLKTEYQGMEGHLVILLCTVSAEAGCGWRTGGVRGHCEQHRPQYTCTVKAVHKVTIQL